MKRIFVIFILTAFTLSAYSQDKIDLDWGIKVGLNNSKITFNKDDYSPENILNYHFGGYARLNLGRVYIQPEAYFISKGGDIKEIVSFNPISTISSFDYKMVDVPVLAGVTVMEKKVFNLRIMAGPVFSFNTKKDVETVQGEAIFSKENLKNSFIGWQYGIGADVLFFTFDARIDHSLGKVYEDTGMDAKSKSLLLSLGIKF